MGKRVKVYRFTGWDTLSQQSINLPIPIRGTAEFIKELGGELIEESAMEVDEDQVVDGIYYAPQRRSMLRL